MMARNSKIFPRYDIDIIVEIYLMMQQLLFVAHNSFEQDKKSPAYVLLRILRSFTELDTYLAFDLQTEETIAAGWEEMAKFAKLIKV